VTLSISVGEPAPDFTLVNQHGEQVSLSQYKGKSAVALVFYPLSFSGTCTGELCELRDNLNLFEDSNVELLAISVDSKFTQSKFAATEGYKFQLLADFWPHGKVSSDYGVFLEERGHGTRGTFLISKDGEVVAKIITSPGEPRDLAAYKKALELL
jgi:mycoredoxin-dependent peroxiredoxin